MEYCVICERPVTNYAPVYCCSDHNQECGCRGMPLIPCVCSERCERAVYDHIGEDFDVCRQLAGIEKYDSRLTTERTIPKPEASLKDTAADMLEIVFDDESTDDESRRAAITLVEIIARDLLEKVI